MSGVPLWVRIHVYANIMSKLIVILILLYFQMRHWECRNKLNPSSLHEGNNPMGFVVATASRVKPRLQGFHSACQTN